MLNNSNPDSPSLLWDIGVGKNAKFELQYRAIVRTVKICYPLRSQHDRVLVSAFVTLYQHVALQGWCEITIATHVSVNRISSRDGREEKIYNYY